MNFVCIVFELGDKMLTLSSMENLIVQCNLLQPVLVCSDLAAMVTNLPRCRCAFVAIKVSPPGAFSLCSLYDKGFLATLSLR